MADLDQWLTKAAAATNSAPSAAAMGELGARLNCEPLPQSISTQRDARRMMVCAGVAALLGFAATGVSGAFAKSSPTWIAAPSASSPYSLLVGN